MQGNTEKFIHTLGDIIKKYRLLSGKSIYKISAESGIPKTTWRRIEQGIHKDIFLTSLWKISEGLDISPSIIIAELKETLGEDFYLSDDI